MAAQMHHLLAAEGRPVLEHGGVLPLPARQGAVHAALAEPDLRHLAVVRELALDPPLHPRRWRLPPPPPARRRHPRLLRPLRRRRGGGLGLGAGGRGRHCRGGVRCANCPPSAASTDC